MAERTRSRRTAAAALIAVGTLLATACSSADAGSFSGRVLDNPYPVADLALTDTDGDDFSLVAQTDKPLTLVFFGYTDCPDVCPMVLSNLASAMTQLDERDRDDVDVVFVTTDPATDDEKTIRAYLDRIDPDFVGLTAPLDDVVAVGDSIKLYVSDGERLPSGGYDLGGHTSSVVGVDPSDEAVVYWSDQTTPRQFADDIHALLEES